MKILNMSMSITHEIKRNPCSSSKLKPEWGRDVLKIPSTLPAINLLPGCLWDVASPGNQMWMADNPNSNTRCISVESVFPQWTSRLFALLPKLIPPDLLHKEPRAFQAACINCMCFPLENLADSENAMVPKEATSLLWTNLQSTKNM